MLGWWNLRIGIQERASRVNS